MKSKKKTNKVKGKGKTVKSIKKNKGKVLKQKAQEPSENIHAEGNFDDLAKDEGVEFKDHQVHEGEDHKERAWKEQAIESHQEKWTCVDSLLAIFGLKRK